MCIITHGGPQRARAAPRRRRRQCRRAGKGQALGRRVWGERVGGALERRGEAMPAHASLHCPAGHSTTACGSSELRGSRDARQGSSPLGSALAGSVCVLRGLRTEDGWATVMEGEKSSLLCVCPSVNHPSCYLPNYQPSHLSGPSPHTKSLKTLPPIHPSTRSSTHPPIPSFIHPSAPPLNHLPSQSGI